MGKSTLVERQNLIKIGGDVTYLRIHQGHNERQENDSIIYILKRGSDSVREFKSGS